MNATMVENEVEKKIVKIIANEAGLHESHIKRNMVIDQEFGLDSLAMVEITMAIEEEFGLDIPDEDIDKMKTVGDAVDYIISKT